MEHIQQTAELILDARATLGEGPSWDHRTGLLLWVDIEKKQVHFFNPADGSNRTIQLNQMVGAAAPRVNGGLVLAMECGLYTMDPETERLTRLVDPEAGVEGNRFNDGKCDEAGRFWAGTMNMRGDQPTGALYCLETDGTLRKEVEGVTVSNGLGWSPDGRTMYYIDTPTKRVVAYDYSPREGKISNGRTVVGIPEDEGFPDGMTVDEEGMLWIAHWDGWQVSRWNPRTGEKIGSVRLPAARVSCCTFGGEHFDELYITTARSGLTEEQLAEQPYAGGMFRIKPGVKGRPTFFYGG